MMKMTQFISVSLFSIVCSISMCSGEQDIAMLQDLLNQSSLEEVRDFFTSSQTTIKWPYITSKKNPTKVDEKGEYEKVFKVVSSLFGKIQEFEKAKSKDDSAECLDKTFLAYGDIGKILYRSGGYTNLLLLDSMNRCALTRLSHLLVNNSKDYEKYKPFIEQLQVPRLSNEEIESILAEESTIRDASEQMQQIQKFGLMQFVSSVDKNGTNLKDFQPVNTKTSFLLENGGCRALLMRLMDPLRLHQIDLPGMIEYLERGGKFEDIGMYAGNMSLFRNLMGESLQKFRLELTGDKRFGPVNLSVLIRMFKDAPYQNVFYSVAVE